MPMGDRYLVERRHGTKAIREFVEPDRRLLAYLAKKGPHAFGK
jgi:transposase